MKKYRIHFERMGDSVVDKGIAKDVFDSLSSAQNCVQEWAAKDVYSMITHGRTHAYNYRIEEFEFKTIRKWTILSSTEEIVFDTFGEAQVSAMTLLNNELKLLATMKESEAPSCVCEFHLSFFNNSSNPPKVKAENPYENHRCC